MSTLSAQHWDSKVKKDPYCIEEFYFWKNNLNSFKVRDYFLFNKPQRFAYSDASAIGCGSIITLKEDCVCHKFWEPSERSKSSTWRELAAIDFIHLSIHYYLSLQRAMATLVVPSWPSSSFWRLLTSKYLWFIKGCFTLNASQTLTLGRNLCSFLGSPRFTGEVVALRFEFL